MYTLLNEIGKSLISNMVSNFFMIVLGFLRLVPRKIELEFNSVLITEDPKDILEAYKVFKKKMFCRFATFTALSYSIFLLCIYYVTIFGNIYVNSSEGLLYSAVISFIIQVFGIGLIVPTLQTVFRFLVIKYPKKKCLIMLHRCSYYLKLAG